MLRWAIELGRIDIDLEVAMMAPYSASPRIGHIEALYNIFSYLMMHDESALAFDATKPDIDESTFQEVDWKFSMEKWRRSYHQRCLSLWAGR